MNKNDREFITEKIRTQYMDKDISELDELRRLDSKVKRPANIFSYIFGGLGAIIMGSGMSLVMTDIADRVGISDPMLPGLIIGIIGMLIAIFNYPIYKKILGSRKKKYAKDILTLSEKIMNK